MKSTFKPEIKKPTISLGATARMLLLYFVTSIAVFSAFAVIGKMVGPGNLLYVLLAVGMLLLGGLHLWLMGRFFEWDQPDLQKSIFTFGVGLIAVSVLFFFFRNSENQFNNFYSVTGLAFCLPHFYKMAVDQILRIPVKMFKPFMIQNFDDIDRGEITFEENARGLIWKFETKNEMTSDLSLPTEPVRMFAPTQVFQMPFKKLFKASVLFHNVRLKPDKPIHVFEDTSTGEKAAYQWYFMHRPIPYAPLRYIDPDKTVAQNKIKFSRRKTNYGKEILAPEIFVIRKESDKISTPEISEVVEKTENIPDANLNNTGAASSRVEF